VKNSVTARVWSSVETPEHLWTSLEGDPDNAGGCPPHCGEVYRLVHSIPGASTVLSTSVVHSAAAVHRFPGCVHTPVHEMWSAPRTASAPLIHNPQDLSTQLSTICVLFGERSEGAARGSLIHNRGYFSTKSGPLSTSGMASPAWFCRGGNSAQRGTFLHVPAPSYSIHTRCGELAILWISGQAIGGERREWRRAHRPPPLLLHTGCGQAPCLVDKHRVVG
jgi:hypothetical protein